MNNYLLKIFLVLFVFVIFKSALANEQFACGPECFQYLLNHFGIELNDNQIYDTFDNPFNNEMSANELIKAAEKYEFEGYVLECSFEELAKNPFPCIVQVKNKYGNYHFTVLLGMNANSVILKEPKFKPIILDKLTFESNYTGFVIYLLPQNKAEQNLLTPHNIPFFIDFPSEIFVHEEQNQYIVPFEIINVETKEIKLDWHETNCTCMIPQETMFDVDDLFVSYFTLNKNDGWKDEYQFFLESKDYVIQNKFDVIQVPKLNVHPARLAYQLSAEDDISIITFVVEGLSPLSNDELRIKSSLKNTFFEIKSFGKKDKYIDRKIVELFFNPKEHIGVQKFKIFVDRVNDLFLESTTREIDVSIEVLSDFVLFPRYILMLENMENDGYVGEIIIKSDIKDFWIELSKKPDWIETVEIIDIHNGYHLIVKSNNEITGDVDISTVILNSNDRYSPKIEIPILF